MLHIDVKLLLLELELTTPSNQMDLDQDIPVINQRDKNVSPDERHKWRMPELPPVPKEIYQSQYKNWFMAAKQQEWELLPSLSIGTMNSYLQVKKFMGPEKTEKRLKGCKPISCKGQVQQIKTWSKNQSMLSEDQKTKLAQGKENSPVEAPQASTSAKHTPENPKDQPEGQEKGKSQVEQALPTELQDSQQREGSHGQCVQYGKNSDGILKQGKGKIEPIFSKKVDLVKLVNQIVNQIETCNKEIIKKIKTFEYIQQKLCNEILQVKESQKTSMGLENINKDNILSLRQICARIESKFTLLNQPDDNSIFL
ncbi:hypothetical protein O181_128937 [Austropuccinia psidii MF-1]|uniref:Uncharacterized protein n=1 Tax=Austropuccinia psidii MF-1 TaxID=1389203 RepID=A0A9Q3QAZ6_9BASI|nr:hypothetical protein [Austropuccinia psidii MF-1]